MTSVFIFMNRKTFKRTWGDRSSGKEHSGPGFDYQYLPISSQPSAAPVPRNPIPFLGPLWIPSMCVVHMAYVKTKEPYTYN